MKKWWFGPKKHLDEEKIEAQKRAKRDLNALYERDDEEGFVAYVKALKPDITKEELKEYVMLFRDEVQRRLRGQTSP